MATVAVGPMPGKTPISVPRSAPIKQNKMLVGVRASEKPSIKTSRNSMIGPPAKT